MAKPVTRTIRSERRARAEERQTAYDALSTRQKLDRAQGSKERTKLSRRLAKETKDGS